MKPLFTVHAGEYLVGSYIEEKYKNLNVWIPSKDTGIDLLVTDSENKYSASLQVKFSKDFLVTHMEDTFQKDLVSCGWWTLNYEKIEASKADFWVFVLHSFHTKKINYVIIKPDELLSIYQNIHKKQKNIQTYLWVTNSKKCWETRGLGKKDQILIANDAYKNNNRELTKFLNNWTPVLKAVKST